MVFIDMISILALRKVQIDYKAVEQESVWKGEKHIWWK
jgi:hypothetical protein